MKKGFMFVWIVGLLLMFVGCAKSVEPNEELVMGDIQENVKDSADETSGTVKEEAPESVVESDKDKEDATSPTEFDVENYLNEHYSLDNSHFEAISWENEDTGTTDYTVNIVPDLKEHSNEMKEKFQNAHMNIYEEIETMTEAAKQMMDELPKINSKLRIDSVNWVSHDGEFSVMLLQDYENSSIKVEGKKSSKTLSQFSSQQIECARVWLLLGPNQEIDELNVRIIPAGEPVNPHDETSATYPEEVIQLTGSRLVDGSVTYSGNGDGTINVYNVPLRFEKNVPEDLDRNYMRILTEGMIENTELVYVDPGQEEDIIELIKLQKIH
ncbi:hypothetical protein K7887_02665 [Sutcliffiella horikoshii]|uniref:hypothetical protein n=1 Tax=Sutcliffiella horikoshii TaxID=79883 RepID=UPI0037DA1B84|nr:hypothetical protein K7887_02665 [Sutcliffiella horikoshii]